MKKELLVTAFLTVILICGVVLVGTVRFSKAETGSYVGGPINSNTTWTKSKSPYILIRSLTVGYGAILTIEPGVIVDLNDYSIQINGVLTARGNLTDKVTFMSQSSNQGSLIFASSAGSWNQQANSGCIIENANIYVPLFILGASPKINMNIITPHITIHDGSPVISNNTIAGDIQNNDYASPLIDNNSITGGIWAEGFMVNSLVITNNNIRNGSANNNYAGIFCWGINPYVADNVVHDCSTGVTVYSAGVIERNLISNNSRGITLGSDAGSVIIRNNTITGNEVGVYCYSLPKALTFTNNNIESNVNQSVSSSSISSVNATYNWWGTINQTAIERTINGKVTFVPFLATPNPNAMPDPTADSSINQQPSIPETFPSGIILTLLTTASLIGITTSRRKRYNKT